MFSDVAVIAGTPPEDHHLEAHTGCELSFRVHARDVSPHCSPDVPGSMNGGGCQVSVSLVPEGSIPRTSSGLPEGINGRGGAASFVRDDDESNGVEERWVFRWAPVRGQESMKPYKVSFKPLAICPDSVFFCEREREREREKRERENESMKRYRVRFKP